MEAYQKEFIELALKKQVLKFGEFTLKSGRKSPYFFNAGLFNDGESLHVLGKAYAAALRASGLDLDVLFGPAYKGIPIATAIAQHFAASEGRNIPVAYNRKEAKTHGEGGVLVGAPVEGDVVIVDDVITAGTAVREVIGMIQQAKARPAGVVVALDRQEKGQNELSAIQEIQKEYGMPVVSIVNLDQVLEYMKGENSLADSLSSVLAYREQYGV